jgi:hypothetical protein
MSKSEFRFRFRHRNSDSDFDFRIWISILTSKFRFWHHNLILMSKFQSIFHWNKSKFLFWLLIGISTPTVEIEIEIPITFDNFDQKCRRKAKLISVETLFATSRAGYILYVYCCWGRSRDNILLLWSYSDTDTALTHSVKVNMSIWRCWGRGAQKCYTYSVSSW